MFPLCDPVDADTSVQRIVNDAHDNASLLCNVNVAIPGLPIDPDITGANDPVNAEIIGFLLSIVNVPLLCHNTVPDQSRILSIYPVAKSVYTPVYAPVYRV